MRLSNLVIPGCAPGIGSSYSGGGESGILRLETLEKVVNGAAPKVFFINIDFRLFI